MKKCYTLFFLLPCSLIVSAQLQTPNLDWAFAAGNTVNGNTDDDISQALCLDAHNNIYITGSYNGTTDFDAGTGTFNLTSTGSNDLFILKTDIDGNFKWAKTFGSSDGEKGEAIAYDDHGCIYVAGRFGGSIDFDDGVGTNMANAGSDQDIFIQKIDTLGNVIWTRTMAGTAATTNSPHDLEINYDLNAIYMCGYFEGAVDFDPGTGTDSHTATGDRSVFIQKLDMLGNVEWTRSFGNAGSAVALSLESDVDGNVYATGHFQGTIDFDPGAGTTELISAGNSDIFVIKLNSGGDLVWAKSAGGNYDDRGESLTLSESGHVLISGSFGQTVDFDPGAGTTDMTATGLADIFIWRLDSQGEFDWVKTVQGSVDASTGLSLTTDAAGNVYTTGYFWGINDFDPGNDEHNLTPVGASDIFVQKLDSLGNFMWAQSFGHSGADWGNAMQVDENQHVYVAGVFKNTVDFDPWTEQQNLTSQGGWDIFVMRMNQDTNYLNTPTHASMTDFVIYPNPATETATLTWSADQPVLYVQIFDLSGRLVYAQNPVNTNGKMMLELNTFESGTYIVAVTTESGTTAQKLMITR